MTATPASREDTFPKLLARNAAVRGAAGHPPQGSRHLADLDLGAGRATRCAPSPSACSELGLEARRHGRHHRRQPAAPLLDASRPRRALGAHPGAGLRRTRSPTRWPTCSSTPRSTLRRRRRTRSRSTSCSRSPTALPRLRAHRLRRAARPARLRPRAACTPSTTCRRSAARRWRPIRGAARWRWTRDRRGQGHRPRGHALHLRHHRPAQGRDADATTTSSISAANGNDVRQPRPRRRGARLSADGLGRRPHLLLRARPIVAGFCVELPGEPGDGDRGPARDRHRPTSSRRRASSRTC